MKKQLILLAAALAAVLAGCSFQTAEESPEVSLSAIPTAKPAAAVTIRPTVAPTAELPEETIETLVPDEESAPPVTLEPVATPTVTPAQELPVRPSDEEVLSAYRQAVEAYGWFTGFFDQNDTAFLDQKAVERRPGPAAVELEYCRVVRPGLDSMDALRSYLKRLFSDEIVDPLLTGNAEAPSFIETEAGLYLLCAGVGGDPAKGAVTLVAVLWPEEEAPAGCVVRVTQEKLEWSGDKAAAAGEWVYEFPYQKVGEKWVFTQFESIF